MTFFATGFFAGAFFATGFFAGAFFATGFFAGAFFATGFLATGFFTAAFFTVGFLATGFFAAGFFTAGFLAAGFAAGFFAVVFKNENAILLSFIFVLEQNFFVLNVILYETKKIVKRKMQKSKTKTQNFQYSSFFVPNFHFLNSFLIFRKNYASMSCQ